MAKKFFENFNVNFKDCDPDETPQQTHRRSAVFRNHAKIYAGIGNKFAFGIETSANINTNPRTENGCITIGNEIFEFYKNYFDGIISFGKCQEETKI